MRQLIILFALLKRIVMHIMSRARLAERSNRCANNVCQIPPQPSNPAGRTAYYRYQHQVRVAAASRRILALSLSRAHDRN